MKEYEDKHRTNHEDIPPTIERIKDLRRKILHFENPSSLMAIAVHSRSITLVDKYPKKKEESPDLVSPLKDTNYQSL